MFKVSVMDRMVAMRRQFYKIIKIAGFQCGWPLRHIVSKVTLEELLSLIQSIISVYNPLFSTLFFGNNKLWFLLSSRLSGRAICRFVKVDWPLGSRSPFWLSASFGKRYMKNKLSPSYRSDIARNMICLVSLRSTICWSKVMNCFIMHHTY